MSREVLDMIGAKFAGRDAELMQNRANATVQGGSFEMDADELAEYQQAQANGDVSTMIAIKSGAKRNQRQSAQFAEEQENFDISKVTKELRNIDSVISGLESKYETELDQARADIEAKYEQMAEKLLKKGVARGSRQHLILQDDFVREYQDISEGNRFKSFRQEIKDLHARKIQLSHMSDQYKEEHADLIDEARREKVKQTLKELDLI